MTINHDSRCKRPTPHLRRSWTGEPEAYCPGCGRNARLEGQAPGNTNSRTIHSVSDPLADSHLTRHDDASKGVAIPWRSIPEPASMGLGDHQ